MRSWKLQRKIALIFFLTMAAVSIGGLIWLYEGVSFEAVRMNTSLQFSNLDIAEENIENLLKSAENAAISCFYGEDTLDSLLGDVSLDEDLALRREVQSALYSAVNVQSAIGDIVIFRRDGSSISCAGSIQYPYDDYDSCIAYYERQGVSQESIENYSVWTSLGQDFSSGKYCLANIRKLHHTDTHEATAVMLVLLKEKSLRELYSFFGEGSYLVNEEGDVLSAADPEMISRNIREEPFFQSVLASRETGETHFTYEAEKRFCIYIPQFASYLVAVPDAGILNSLKSSVSTLLATSLALILCCSVLASVIISKGIVRPIDALAQAMKKARNGNFKVRCNVRGSDEIHYLGETFNTLMNDIERYIAQLTQKEKEKQAYELRFLQAQINPHLLYNSLDSVLAYLASNDTQHAQQVLEQLSGFFKIALHRGDTFVALRQEVEHVRKYMELQRLCRGKMIQLDVRIPEDLLRGKIMRTTLQPIVENSFMHAFVGSVNDGRIEIEAGYVEDDRRVEIRVTDDGLGMDAASVKAVMANLDSDDIPARAGGFGLKNVNHRLKSYYGNRYGLTLESVLGEFTRVVITLPVEGEQSCVPTDDRR